MPPLIAQRRLETVAGGGMSILGPWAGNARRKPRKWPRVQRYLIHIIISNLIQFILISFAVQCFGHDHTWSNCSDIISDGVVLPNTVCLRGTAERKHPEHFNYQVEHAPPKDRNWGCTSSWCCRHVKKWLEYIRQHFPCRWSDLRWFISSKLNIRFK